MASSPASTGDRVVAWHITCRDRPFAVGLRAACGSSTATMGAGFVAFGATSADLGLDPCWAVAASLLIYGLPGQVVLAGGMADGRIGIGDALAPAVANARFLPLSAALGLVFTRPNLGLRRIRPSHLLRLLAVAHLVGSTAWAVAMTRCPDMPERERLSWFAGFGLASWLAAAACTALGALVSASLPSEARAVLLFVTPLYFALLLGADVIARPAARTAIVAGGLAAPFALWLPASWGALAIGVVAGTIAWVLGCVRR